MYWSASCARFSNGVPLFAFGVPAPGGFLLAAFLAVLAVFLAAVLPAFLAGFSSSWTCVSCLVCHWIFPRTRRPIEHVHPLLNFADQSF